VAELVRQLVFDCIPSIAHDTMLDGLINEVTIRNLDVGTGPILQFSSPASPTRVIATTGMRDFKSTYIYSEKPGLPTSCHPKAGLSVAECPSAN
jgi:hypothetical protein